MKKELVVSKYTEDISWRAQVPPDWSCTIYSKDPNETDPAFIKLPNLGREAHTYLVHIVNRFDEIADITVFTQGDPLDHVPRFIEILQDLKSVPEYLPLSSHDFFFDDYGNPHLTGNPPTSYGMHFKQFYEYLIGERCPTLNYCFGNAIFAVAKESIRAHPRDFYLKCLDTITRPEGNLKTSRVGVNIMEAHFFERLWHVIFSPERRIKIETSKFEKVRAQLEARQEAMKAGNAKDANNCLIRANDILDKLRNG